MDVIRFLFPDGTSEEVESYTQLNVLAHAQIAEKSLQSRCGGHCECSTCRIILRSGNLSPMKESERALMIRAKIPTDGGWRLACQCFPEAGEEVVIEVPKSKFQDARKS